MNMVIVQLHYHKTMLWEAAAKVRGKDAADAMNDEF